MNVKEVVDGGNSSPASVDVSRKVAVFYVLNSREILYFVDRKRRRTG